MTWAMDLGIRDGWHSSDLAEVTAHSRKLWQQKKEENGWSPWAPNRDIPGFLECLQEMFDGGYSFTDIASVFGLSRQRMERLFVEEPELDATDREPHCRYWDDDASRFVPMNREAIRDRWRAVRRRQRLEANKGRRWELVQELRRAIEELGYVPGVYELVDHTGRHILPWAYHWRRRLDGSSRSYTVAMDRLYRSAGHTRPDGRADKSDAFVAANRARRNHTSKEAREVRRLFDDGMAVAEIARRFDMNSGVAWAIAHRRTYGDLEGS